MRTRTYKVTGLFIGPVSVKGKMTLYYLELGMYLSILCLCYNHQTAKVLSSPTYDTRYVLCPSHPSSSKKIPQTIFLPCTSLIVPVPYLIFCLLDAPKKMCVVICNATPKGLSLAPHPPRPLCCLLALCPSVHHLQPWEKYYIFYMRYLLSFFVF